MIWGEKNKYCPSNFFPTPQGRDGWWFSRELSNSSGGEQSTASRSPSHTKLWNETEVALWVRNPPANAGDAGSILGSGHPLEEEVTTHSSILAWKIPWREEPGGLQPMGSQSRAQVSSWARTHEISGWQSKIRNSERNDEEMSKQDYRTVLPKISLWRSSKYS